MTLEEAIFARDHELVVLRMYSSYSIYTHIKSIHKELAKIVEHWDSGDINDGAAVPLSELRLITTKNMAMYRKHQECAR